MDNLPGCHRKTERLELPEGWNIVKLESICNKITDGTHVTPEYLEEGIPFISVKNLTNGDIDFTDVKYISEKQHIQLTKTSKPEVGDILYTKVGTFGIARRIKTNREFSIFVSVALIKPNHETVDSGYLEYILNSRFIYSQAQKRVRGIGVPDLHLGEIRQFKVVLPPLPVQRRIVSILEKAEETKRLRAQADELTERLLQSVFLEMFGDPVRNPKGWETVKLSQIVNIEKKQINSENITAGTKYIGLEHIESNTGDIIKIISLNENDLKSSKFTFTKKHILYGKLRPYLNKIALPSFEGICSTDILPLIPMENKSNRYFIAFLLRHPYYIKLATERSSGANLPRISPKELTSFEIFCPPLPLQQKFAHVVEKIESMRKNQNESKQHIEDLFSTMMQEAFKGELMV